MNHISFKEILIPSVLDGSKPVTRRIIKPQPIFGGDHWLWKGNSVCPYGSPGDKLWVRETHRFFQPHQEEGVIRGVEYKVDSKLKYEPPLDEDEGCLINRLDDRKWRSSKLMPKWASRITLEIIKTRPEKLQEITNEDAVREGVKRMGANSWWAGAMQGTAHVCHANPRAAFMALWDEIYAEKGCGWDVNPWVWRISFRKITNTI